MYADRPAETFFLFHRARRILFLMSQKENGGAHRGKPPTRLDSPSNGTHWAHPPWKQPPAGAGSPRRQIAAPYRSRQTSSSRDSS